VDATPPALPAYSTAVFGSYLSVLFLLLWTSVEGHVIWRNLARSSPLLSQSFFNEWKSGFYPLPQLQASRMTWVLNPVHLHSTYWLNLQAAFKLVDHLSLKAWWLGPQILKSYAFMITLFLISSRVYLLLSYMSIFLRYLQLAILSHRSSISQSDFTHTYVLTLLPQVDNSQISASGSKLVRATHLFNHLPDECTQVKTPQTHVQNGLIIITFGIFLLYL
jgi:hypothetical protein